VFKGYLYACNKKEGLRPITYTPRRKYIYIYNIQSKQEEGNNID
jgi:hypothetical protein